LRSQRAFPVNFFVFSDLNDKDVPDITEKIGNDESMNFGNDNGLTKKDDNNKKNLTRFSYIPTFSYGSNQKDKKILREANKITSLKRFTRISRSKKTRGKRPVAAANKSKQSQVTKGIKCACNPFVNREWLGKLDK
jgi:hypothetical protein